MFVFSDRKIYRAGVPPNSREIQEGLLTLSYTVGRPWRWSSQQSIGKREWVTPHLYIARLTIHFFVDIIQDCKGVQETRFPLKKHYKEIHVLHLVVSTCDVCGWLFDIYDRDFETAAGSKEINLEKMVVCKDSKMARK